MGLIYPALNAIFVTVTLKQSSWTHQRPASSHLAVGPVGRADESKLILSSANTAAPDNLIRFVALIYAAACAAVLNGITMCLVICCCAQFSSLWFLCRRLFRTTIIIAWKYHASQVVGCLYARGHCTLTQKDFFGCSIAMLHSSKILNLTYSHSLMKYQMHSIMKCQL